MNLLAPRKALPIKQQESGTDTAVAGRRVRAALGFRRNGARTFLAHQHCPHPFHITLPFFLPGDPEGMATLYLQSSSGGLYGDDDLGLDVRLEPGAKAHVTTQASTIVHAARGGTTRQAVKIDCAADGWLEYLPDPMILFSGARLEAKLRVRLGKRARIILSDSFLSHDPSGSDRPFDFFANDIEIRREAQATPVLIDRVCLSDTNWPTGSPGCHGSLCLATDGSSEDAAVAVERSLAEAGLDPAACYSGVNPLPERGLVWVRLLCRDGSHLTAALDAAWRGARRALADRPPPQRRK